MPMTTMDQPRDEIPCPACAKPILRAAKKCKHCKAVVNVLASTTTVGAKDARPSRPPVPPSTVEVKPRQGIAGGKTTYAPWSVTTLPPNRWPGLLFIAVVGLVAYPSFAPSRQSIAVPERQIVTLTAVPASTKDTATISAVFFTDTILKALTLITGRIDPISFHHVGIRLSDGATLLLPTDLLTSSAEAVSEAWTVVGIESDTLLGDKRLFSYLARRDTTKLTFDPLPPGYRGGGLSAPTFSPDGRFLAYLKFAPQDSIRGSVWSISNRTEVFETEAYQATYANLNSAHIVWRDASGSVLFSLPREEAGTTVVDSIVGWASQQAQAVADQQQRNDAARQQDSRLRLVNECARIVGYTNYDRLLSFANREAVPQHAIDLFTTCVMNGGRLP